MSEDSKQIIREWKYKWTHSHYERGKIICGTETLQKERKVNIKDF